MLCEYGARGPLLRDPLQIECEAQSMGRGWTTAPLHREDSAQVAQAPVPYAPWTPAWGGVPGMWEAQRKPQDTAERVRLGWPGTSEELEEVSVVREGRAGTACGFLAERRAAY